MKEDSITIYIIHGHTFIRSCYSSFYERETLYHLILYICPWNKRIFYLSLYIFYYNYKLNLNLTYYKIYFGINVDSNSKHLCMDKFFIY